MPHGGGSFVCAFVMCVVQEGLSGAGGWRARPPPRSADVCFLYPIRRWGVHGVISPLRWGLSLSEPCYQEIRVYLRAHKKSNFSAARDMRL